MNYKLIFEKKAILKNFEKIIIFVMILLLMLPLILILINKLKIKNNHSPN